MLIFPTINIAQCDKTINYEMQMIDFFASLDDSVARWENLTLKPSQNLMLELDCLFAILLARVVAKEALYSWYARLKSLSNDSLLELRRASFQESSCINSIKAHVNIGAEMLLRHFDYGWKLFS